MLTSCATCSGRGRRARRDASRRCASEPSAAAPHPDRVRPHPSARPARLWRSGDPERQPLPCFFASARAAVGSRSPRPSARPRRCDGRGGDRARPDHHRGRSRPDAALRRDRQPWRVREGARGGAPRRADRRRRPLRQGHDLDGHDRPRRRRVSGSGGSPRRALRSRPRSSRGCGSARHRSDDAPSSSHSSRASPWSHSAATSTPGCGSGSSAVSTRSCSRPAASIAWASPPRSACASTRA